MSPSAYQIYLEPRVELDLPALDNIIKTISESGHLLDTLRLEMKEILELTERDIADYDAELNRLWLRREMARKYAAKLRIVLSPIKYLPNELLGHIFEYCCEQNDLTRYNTSSALTLSSVCGRWRSLVLTTPELWSSLKIYLDEEDFQEGRHQEEINQAEVKLTAMVGLYLRRSKEVPLTLDISAVARLVPEGSEHAALSLLVQHSSRWKTLVWRGCSFNSRSFPSLSRPLSLLLLETLQFEEYGDDPPHTTAFEHAPRICDLKLRGTDIDSSTLDTFSSLWNLLTSLSYDTSGTFEHLWPVLDRCPELRHLALQGTNDPRLREAASAMRRVSPKKLSSLSSFTVTNHFFCVEYDALECIMASLTLPHLTELTLEQEDVDQWQPTSAPFGMIDAFFSRSNCPLTSLTICAVSLTDKEMVALLLRLPTLQELFIADAPCTYQNCQPISTSFIQSLHTWERSDLHRLDEPLVPNLRSLTLKVTTLDFNASSFVRTVVSRWFPDPESMEFGVVCLRSVELHLRVDDDLEVYEPLRDLDAAGMRVVVKCQDREGYVI